MSVELACPHCLIVVTRPRLAWQQMVSGRWHLRADCPRCGAWVKWAPQTPEWLALAPERPETPAIELPLPADLFDATGGTDSSRRLEGARRMKADFIIKQQGKDFVLYEGLLDQAHQEGLKRISVEIVQVPCDQNGMVAICRAEVETSKGSFADVGDASPQNTNRMVASHILRMASTRAKARALRDAVNIGMVAVEELADVDGDQPQAKAQPARPATAPAPPPQRQTASGKPVDANGVIAEVAPPKQQPAPQAQAAAPAATVGGQPATEIMRRRVRDLAQRAGQTVADEDMQTAEQAQWHISRLVELLNEQAKAKRGNGTGH